MRQSGSGRFRLFASLAVLLASALFARRTHAETLTITSTPPGASIEINGLAAGTTPYTVDYPGAYFHKPHTVFTSRLDHSMNVKVSLDGYVTERVTLTEGPFEWISFNGRHHGSYFLLKSSHFTIHLDPVGHAGAATDTNGREGPLIPAPASTFRPTERNAALADASVAIGSDPPGADIYVDGDFVGQTPSTIRLAEGRHRIELKSPGKQSWSRDLNVTKESQLSLHPSLAAAP